MPPRSAGTSPFLPIDQEILAGLVREEALQRENDALWSYFRCALDFFAKLEAMDREAAQEAHGQLRKIASEILVRAWEHE